MDKLHLEGSFRLAYNASLFVKEGLGFLLAFDRLIDTSPGSGLVFRPFTPKLETNIYHRCVDTKSAVELSLHRLLSCPAQTRSQGTLINCQVLYPLHMIHSAVYAFALVWYNHR